MTTARDETPSEPLADLAPGHPLWARSAAVVRRWSAYWCFLLAFVLVVVPNWPGRINNDTVGMLQQIDRRRISNWHSPVLQYLYVPVRELGGGIAPAFVVTFTVAFAGMLLVFENFGLSRLKCALLALGTCLFPVTYGLLASVTRDAWFLALWLLALGLARTHRITGARRCAVLFAVLFFAYAARQNAIAIAPILFGAALWDVQRARGRAWLRWGAACALTAMLLVVMTVVLAVLPIRKQHPGAAVYLCDLIRLSVRAEELLIPPELNPNGLTVEFLDENTEPWTLDQIVYYRDRMPVQLDSERAKLARDTWLDLVLDDPIEYLRMRWELMTYQIGLGGNTRNVFIPTMIDNPYGIRPAFPHLFKASTDYQGAFTDSGTGRDAGVVHRLWPVLIVSAVAAAAALRHRRGAAYTFDACTSSFVSLALIFVVAPQVHFRYVGPVYVVLGIACLGLLWPWYGGRPTPVSGTTELLGVDEASLPRSDHTDVGLANDVEPSRVDVDGVD